MSLIGDDEDEDFNDEPYDDDSDDDSALHDPTASFAGPEDFDVEGDEVPPARPMRVRQTNPQRGVSEATEALVAAAKDRFSAMTNGTVPASLRQRGIVLAMFVNKNGRVKVLR